ncbi:MAG: DMT family transporter [Burkholderiales bacterium]|nr:DMT family transporter [Burkholderiales bacterium]
MHARREGLSLAVALFVVAVWGANFSLQKFYFAALSPSGFLVARYLIMPACALLLLLWRFGARWPRLSRRDLLLVAWVGFVGHSVHIGMVTWGIHWSTAFSSSLILACGPIFTLIILRAMGVERLHRWQVVGVGIACLGVLVFLSDKLLGGQWRATGGDLFLLLAASVFSYYTVAVKPLVERHGAVTVMAYATLLGGVPILLAAAPTGLAAPWGTLSMLGWAGLLWSIVMSSFVGWLLWAWVNAVRGVARTAPLQYLMPPTAALVAWVFTDERFGAVKMAGAAITLAGVAVAQFVGTRPRENPAPLD